MINWLLGNNNVKIYVVSKHISYEVDPVNNYHTVISVHYNLENAIIKMTSETYKLQTAGFETYEYYDNEKYDIDVGRTGIKITEMSIS